MRYDKHKYTEEQKKNPMVLPDAFLQPDVPKWRDTAELLYGFKVINYDPDFKPRKGYEDYDTPFKEVVDVRIFCTGRHNRRTMGSNRALVWIQGGKTEWYGRGVGIAGGCGYHRPSQALSTALRSAGIKLGAWECGCVGDDAMKQVCLELARRMGYNNLHIVEFHA